MPKHFCHLMPRRAAIARSASLAVFIALTTSTAVTALPAINSGIHATVTGAAPAPSATDLATHKLIVAYNARASGPAEFQYWKNVLTMAGASLVENALGSNVEYTSRMAGLDLPSIINKLFVDLFDHPASDGAAGYYIDGSDTSTRYDVATDGIMLLRYLPGYRDAALTSGVPGSSPSVRNATQISNHIATYRTRFDVDGDGNTWAFTDGLMILRRLLQLSGAALTAGAKKFEPSGHRY